ncbi:MAG: hypothetical protein AYK22_08260 [Thermoplasmatales archaeon SG8-52-3]|nr:MAG: hypothetical protein AYK22_08260 [Thermoplasmatales archaeon SG8-52-3]
MRNLSEAKVYGGIGAILMLVGIFVPYGGPIVSIIGLVFVFIAVKAISEIAKDEDIFRNYLMYFIFTILVFVAIIGILIIAFGAAGGFSWITEISQMQSEEITDLNTFWDLFGDMIIGAIVALIVGWILAIVSALYLRKCYNSIAEHTKVSTFKTTGTLYFIGAITLIILIGFLIIFIAKIIEIVAFFSIPETLPASKGS